MPVDALQLRPRSAVALLDAAIRVCACSSGLWGLTLPAGALLAGALFHLFETLRSGDPLLGAVCALTFAWAFRAVSQGAASHFLKQQLLSPSDPSVWASWAAALRRTPSLISAAAYLAVLNTIIVITTGGMAFMIVGSHIVGYAATMEGHGKPSSLYGTCSKLLGSARHVAPWVRLGGLAQVLLALNLHLTAAMLLYVGSTLIGLDIAFINRFASLDNPTWLAAVGASAFAAFEPLRAATATLLLIDGRVRQEGLDLLAAVAQLPERKSLASRSWSPPPALLALAALLVSTAALASNTNQDRVNDLITTCGLEVSLPETHLFNDGAWQAPSDQASLSRLIARLEQRAYVDDDCEGALASLHASLGQLREAQAIKPGNAATSQQAAKAIVRRPEFQAGARRLKEKPDSEREDASPSWFRRLWDPFWKKLTDWLERNGRTSSKPAPQSALSGAAVVLVATGVLVTGVFLALLFKRGEKARRRGGPRAAAQAPLTDASSALAKAPENWAELADTLAQNGQFREAVRHLYLALLSRLHRDGAIDYDPADSNWECFRTFRGAAALKAPYRDLTTRFDFVWYGSSSATQTAYAQFKETAQLFLHRSDPGPHRA